MFGRRTRRLEERLAACEAVILENQMATDLMVMAIGIWAVKDDPGYLEEMADGLLSTPISETDDWGRQRVISSREHMAAVLRDTARCIRGGLQIGELLKARTQGGMQ